MPDVATRFTNDISPPLPRIFLPEAHDPRVLEAAQAAAERGIARPVLRAPARSGTTPPHNHDVELEQFELIDVDIDEYVAIYSELRGVSASTARQLLDDDAILGALLLRRNEVDGLAAGATRASGEMLSIYNGIIGLEPDRSTASTAIIMETGRPSMGEDGALVYADCAMNVQPSSERLADIAVSTASTTSELFECAPQVAMLSFSTNGSADHDAVQKVRQASQMAEDRIEKGCVEGELQLDAALVPEVQERKIDDPSHCLTGINTLIFPNLDAANIAVKISEYLADMNMIGAMLQGYARPLGEISRGSDAETITELLSAVSLLTKRRRYPYDGEVILEGRLRNREQELTA